MIRPRCSASWRSAESATPWSKAVQPGAYLQADLVDELVLYLAPMLLGDGTRSTGDLGIRTLAEASQWRWDNSGGGRTSNLGADLRLHLEPMPLGIPSGRKGL